MCAKEFGLTEKDVSNNVSKEAMILITKFLNNNLLIAQHYNTAFIKDYKNTTQVPGICLFIKIFGQPYRNTYLSQFFDEAYTKRAMIIFFKSCERISKIIAIHKKNTTFENESILLTPDFDLTMTDMPLKLKAFSKSLLTLEKNLSKLIISTNKKPKNAKITKDNQK